MREITPDRGAARERRRGTRRAYAVSVSEPLAVELESAAAELVASYREAVGAGAPNDVAYAAALCLGRALEAISRAKRSLHPETAWEIAVADVAVARKAMQRLRP